MDSKASEDGQHTRAEVIPWNRVTPALIREAAPEYAKHTGVSVHQAWGLLVREWERRRGHDWD